MRHSRETEQESECEQKKVIATSRHRATFFAFVVSECVCVHFTLLVRILWPFSVVIGNGRKSRTPSLPVCIYIFDFFGFGCCTIARLLFSLVVLSLRSCWSISWSDDRCSLCDSRHLTRYRVVAYSFFFFHFSLFCFRDTNPIIQ